MRVTRLPSSQLSTLCLAAALVSAIAAPVGALPSAGVLSQTEVAVAIGQYAERAPRFLLASGKRHVALDAARTAVLRRRRTLALENVTTRDAIKAIAQQSGLVLMYSDDLLPPGGRVSLRADGITVAAALTDVLLDADVDVVFNRAGSAALVKRIAIALPATGTISGRVTEAQTGVPVRLAQVSVVGTSLARTTDDSGRYVIAGVPAGARTQRQNTDVSSRP